MNNCVGHTLPQQALFRPSVVERHNTACQRSSGNILCTVPSASKAEDVPSHKPFRSSRFLGKTPYVGKGNPLKQNLRTVAMSPQALLAADPASELARKFKLNTNSELEVSICRPTSESPIQIDFQVAYDIGSLVLHWGVIRQTRREWSLPSHYPEGTKLYKNRALRTPFTKVGSISSLRLKIDDPEIEIVEFLILDEAENKWYKHNGRNFQVHLLKQGNQNPHVSVSGNPNIIVPEDLVQIQAYLRWERKGRQAYTPDKEKEEYEAARMELLQEISRGMSIEELRSKLTKKTEVKPASREEKTHRVESHEGGISDDLVQVQAFIRWEKAGKPNYPPEKQLMEFEEARKELQLELDKGTSLAELGEKIMKGSISTNVLKQLKDKKYFSIERIQRKERDIMEILNKNVAETLDEKISQIAPPLTVLELLAKSIHEQDGESVLNQKIYKLDNKDLLVLVTKPFGRTKVYFTTDQSEPLILHWGLSRKSGEWMVPPTSSIPPGSLLLEKSCETPFTKGLMIDQDYQAIQIEIDGGDYAGIPFVLRSDDNKWINNSGLDFYIELGNGSIKSRKAPGDGSGVAKSSLDKIADLETEAQRSLMHRFNIAADLTEQARGSGQLGLAGILVWLRFMAMRHLIWNKNYNVKPREISKAQDRLTDLLQDIYKDSPQYREILRMIMATVGRGGEGDVGQRIRDEILVIQRNNDCKGGMMEEWHQKLHNNTSPDDVVICQALIDYIKSDFDISVYWDTLNKNGITKERLLSYDRAIHSEPSFRRDQKEGLLRDLGNYMRTLKAVHSGADLESAIATCMGYKSEGQGFMVGVQINPIRGLPSGISGLMEFILKHVEDKSVEPLIEGLLEARVELRPLLLSSHERLKDLIFLDIALDSTVRTVVERGYEELSNAEPEKLIYLITLLLENLALSTDDNEDLIYCLKVTI
ncbi:alpha-glucan water dikinase, chloroplastic-like isoform X2 [Zingiber officinale]|uniref:alpha-glucan water dikinase, chloroplastic-like isoform X2 n=1 Tax=Zingiber officinale TaxID=94328 RepID=UPI001C4ADBE3|nr:alpha-glucan water dikinase, chloroplastic-like isoform X2 [Zingiber officinale]